MKLSEIRKPAKLIKKAKKNTLVKEVVTKKDEVQWRAVDIALPKGVQFRPYRSMGMAKQPFFEVIES